MFIEVSIMLCKCYTRYTNNNIIWSTSSLVLHAYSRDTALNLLACNLRDTYNRNPYRIEICLSVYVARDAMTPVSRAPHYYRLSTGW